MAPTSGDLEGGPELPSRAILFAVVATGIAILIWAGRRTLFTVDDLLWFIGSANLDLEGLLQPHNGHLVATSRLVYHFSFELFGAEYLPIRVLTAAAAGATSLLFFAWASRRVGGVVALAGSALLLVLGTSYIFLIAGDGLMLQLALSAGLGALLALERNDRFGDLLACALLCFGVVTYSVALAFVVAAAVAIHRGPNRAARAWVPLIPAVLYAAWWLWAQSKANAPGDGAELNNLLIVPVYAFDSLASTLGAITGLDQDFGGAPDRPEFETTVAAFGPVLALIAIIAFAWRLRRPPVPAAVWVALGFLVPLWLLGALTTDAASPPDSSRLVFFFAVAMLMIAAAAATAIRWPRGAVVAVWAVAAIGIAANLLTLGEGGDFRRDVDEPKLRAELTGIELAAANAQPHPDLSHVAGGAAILNYPFVLAPVEDPSGDYLASAAKYGSLGYGAELSDLPEELRARTDAVLVGATGIALAPDDGALQSANCARRPAESAETVSFELPSGGAVIEAAGAPAEVAVRRFADAAQVPVGTLDPDQPAALRVPTDASSEPWIVTVGTDSVRACTAPRP